MKKKIKIFLDIDDVVADWQGSYCKTFNKKPQKSWDENIEEMNYHLNLLKDHKNFWVNLPVKHFPTFKVSGYLSARGIPKKWTQEFMKINKLPGRSNINQINWNVSKVKKLKEFGVDIFIDDKLETFLECNQNGVFCLLMDASHNRSYKTNLRIKNLDYNIIMTKYNKYVNDKH